MANIFPSPDGCFSLEIFSIPMRMSHEVDCPTLYDAASREILFDPGSLWDASDVRWSEDGSLLNMQMRHYDNGTQVFTLSLDVINQMATLRSRETTRLAGTFEEVQKSMRLM